jgi:predicted aldo/keto reductase-like oxidoreductase
MEYRQFGRSGLKVSVLSLGTMTLVGSGANDAGLSRHHLIQACEASLR